ncbi:MAG: hypothetical protein AAGD25_38465, partial [Cyanobacteria bacterium P01_F01_bin.150]
RTSPHRCLHPNTGLGSSRYGLIIDQLARFVPQVAEWLSDFGFWSLSVDSYIWRPDIMLQPYTPGVFTPIVCAGNFAGNYTGNYAENFAGNFAENYAAYYPKANATGYAKNGYAKNLAKTTTNYIANYAANTVAVSATMAASSSMPHYEPVRHMLFGSIGAVQNTIKLLYVLNYAEPNDWSHPVPSGQPGEVVVVLTKKVRLG